MSEPPSNRPDEPDDEPPREQNPFAGTPFEHMFAAFASGQGGTGGSGMPDLSTLLSQMQRLMTPYEGSVNWGLAKDTARQAVAATPDPSPTVTDQEAVAEAVRLAELWLDGVCTFPAGATRAVAWSRAEWIEKTFPTWEEIVEPVATHVASAMEKALPEEAKSMAGPMIGLLTKAGGSMFGAQVGQALGALAGEVVSSTDIGLPLTAGDEAALIPGNANAFGEGLGLEPSDVLLYLALRECAHQRLFRHVPWLRSHLINAINEYARGMTIDMSKIENSLASFDPSNIEAMQEMLSGGLFEPEETPQQQAALVRLETMLALVEGWVDDVVCQATKDRMPNATRLQEAIRRRRAAGGPAEDTFASLVGLELRPRRLRDAATLWGALRSRQGSEARDAVWAHPDLMPTSADLDDPLGFSTEKRDTEQHALTDEEFDAALADLLERPEATGSADDTSADTSADDTSAEDTSGEDSSSSADDSAGGDVSRDDSTDGEMPGTDTSGGGDSAPGEDERPDDRSDDR